MSPMNIAISQKLVQKVALLKPRFESRDLNMNELTKASSKHLSEAA